MDANIVPALLKATISATIRPVRRKTA